jgi:hypothetical protein
VGRLSDWIAISNERYLHVRLTSPHEYGDGFEEFTDKVDEKQDERGTKYRWNFLGALQTNAFRNMPGCREICAALSARAMPSCANLHSNGGAIRPQTEISRISQHCKKIHVEFCMIDAQHNKGLFLGDFFDFT